MAKELIRVMTASDLRKMRSKKDAHYQLFRDIDLGGMLWNPMGTAASPFTGILDGNGYRIRNFVLQYPSSDGHLGLVSRNQGLICNLTLENVQLLPQGAVAYAGVFAGCNAGHIRNCRVAGALTAAAGSVGCIAGTNTGSIQDCTVEMDLSAGIPEATCFGALTGHLQDGILDNCRVNSQLELSGDARKIGLLAGTANGGSICSCTVSNRNRLNGQPMTALTGTEQDADCSFCLLRDPIHADTQLTPGQLSLRQACVGHMRRQGTLPWTPDVTLHWETVYGHESVTQTFLAGQQYYGLPYTNKYGSLERFCHCFDAAGKLKPFIKDMPNGYDGFDLYMGNDCSGSVYWAWARIGCSFRFRFTGDALPWNDYGLLRVGSYRYEAQMQTDEICRLNGEQVMAEAYAAMYLGDGILQRTKTGGGHIRMCSATPVVFRKQDGTIDLEESYLLCHENGGNLGGWARLRGWNTSWLIDHRYTFRELYETNYIPVTIQELLDGESPKAELLENIDGVNKGSVSSNYRIISTEAMVLDAGGNCLWRDLQFTGICKYDAREYDSPARTTVKTVDLQVHPMPQLGQTGEACRYQVAVSLSNGQTLYTEPFLFTC